MKHFPLNLSGFMSDNDLQDNMWLQTRNVFSAPESAKSACVWFGASRLENYLSTLSCFANVTFQEIALQVKDASDVFSVNQNVNYLCINPTKYTGEISLTEPSLLVFSESFNPSWVCMIGGQRIEPDCVYGAVNGYLINQTGQLTFTLEYKPQELFSVACALSVLTTVLGSAWLLIFFARSFLLKHKRLSCVSK